MPKAKDIVNGETESSRTRVPYLRKPNATYRASAFGQQISFDGQAWQVAFRQRYFLRPP
ncbi:hypothetical protein C8J27_1241, partial [Rhodobacter aestuarii]